MPTQIQLPPKPAPVERRTAGRGDRALTLVDLAYQHLLSMLMSVEIAPDQRIPIDTVARRLAISQTPIREALSQLEAEKLVYKMPNVGYRASPRMTPKEVQDLYTLRLLIEPHAAARAAENMDPAGRATVAEIEAEMNAALRSAKFDYGRFAEADAMLHRFIAVGSGNRLIAETIERLHAHLQIFRSLYSTNAPAEAATEHRAVIKALLAGDARKAERAVHVHLERSQQRMHLASEEGAINAA